VSGSAACSSSIVGTPRRRAARVFAHHGQAVPGNLEITRKLSTIELVQHGDMTGRAGQSGVHRHHLPFGLGWKVVFSKGTTPDVGALIAAGGYSSAVADSSSVVAPSPACLTRTFAFSQ